MANLTRAEILTQAGWERGETNNSFTDQPQAILLLDRCVKKIIRTPGVRTVPEIGTLAITGSGSYALPAGFISLIDLFSGTVGAVNAVKFDYLTPDDFNRAIIGYWYTFKNRGFIEIFASNITALPSTTLNIEFWTKNIVLSNSGLVKQMNWDGDSATSRLQDEYDDLYVYYLKNRILRREGRKEEADDTLAEFNEMLFELTIDGGKPKGARPKRAWGHFQGMNAGAIL